MNFTFYNLAIPGPVLVQPSYFQDHRGFFSEVYREETFSQYKIGPFVQENYSSSTKGVVRGLHYQAAPMEVGKLVSCPHGTIFDIAVDIRPSSPTFSKWVGVVLQDGNQMLWVPPGFAHGFCVLSEQANVLYRQTQYYSKEHDRVVRWDDPDIAVTWPIRSPILSEKDAKAPRLREIS